MDAVQKREETSQTGTHTQPGGGGGSGEQPSSHPELRGMSYDEQLAAVTPAAEAASAPTFERWVQAGLNAAQDASLAVTGKLDKATRSATRAFQKKAKRLQVDGIVGVKTTAALEKATATTAPSLREADAAKSEADEEAPEEQADTGAATVAEKPAVRVDGANAAAKAPGGPTTDAATTTEAPPEPAPAEALPKGLTEALVAAAISWAEGQGYAPEAIGALQAKIGAARTGVYDRNTVVAVYKVQSDGGKVTKVSTPGKANTAFFHKRGLIAFKKAKAVAAPELDALKAAHSGGFPLGVWTNYKTKNGDNIEIEKRAGDWGKAVNAVGVSGGAVTMGFATPITTIEEVVQVVQTVHASLLAKWKATDPKNPDGTPATELPEHLKVRNLALFSHGMEYGLSLNAKGAYKDGLQSGAGGYESNVKSFAKAIAGATTKDLGVQLFACNAGRDIKLLEERTKKAGGDKKKGRDAASYREWTEHDENKRRGDGSFADELNQALEGEGKESSVFAHLTAGHTTENFAARAYGKAAEGVKDTDRKDDETGGGAHMFDVLYTSDYINTQLGRLLPKLPADDAAVRGKARTGLRERMWSHYKDSISSEHKRKESEKRFGEPIGRLMFMNPEAAKKLLQGDFATWLPKHLGDFATTYKKYRA
ncbi:MAG: hypothetical protein CVU56_14930 [Deltaproteobacteria bacterium HGW-Deltaproteobacteria-14]|jgi:peptidoglycan hydrolase-like protein with peptidoglycan-binding domain|nr:MAG: hypothetical protein CVU56_14930 [Deltaproteobacteria bacterium HGW-Deltaproteobacteria-14]